MSYTPTKQYTEGDVDTTVTGTAIMWEDAGDVMEPVSALSPLPVTSLGGPGFNDPAFNVIPLAAYTVTPFALVTNLKNTGIMMFLEITAVGDGFIQPVLQVVNPLVGMTYQLSLGIVPIRATSMVGVTLPTRIGYIFSPGASLNVFATVSGFKYVNPIAVPRDLRIQVTHAGVTLPWTYQLDAVLFG